MKNQKALIVRIRCSCRLNSFVVSENRKRNSNRLTCVVRKTVNARCHRYRRWTGRCCCRAPCRRLGCQDSHDHSRRVWRDGRQRRTGAGSDVGSCRSVDPRSPPTQSVRHQRRRASARLLASACTRSVGRGRRASTLSFPPASRFGRGHCV